MKRKNKYIIIFVLVCFVSALFSPSETFAISETAEELRSSLEFYKQKYSRSAESERTDGKITVSEFFKDGSEETEKADTDKYLEDFYSALPEEVRRELPSGGGHVSFKDFGTDYFTEKINSVAKAVFVPYKKILSGILSLLVISAVAGVFAENLRGSSGDALKAVCSAAVCLYVLSTGLFSPDRTNAFLSSLTEVSTAVVPTTVLLLGATGNPSQGALTGSSMTFLCAALEFLFSKIIYPLVSASAGLSVAGSITNGETAFSVSSFFRKTANLVTVFSMSFLVFIMAVQSTLATAADTLGMKTVKFAVGSFIPLVGGAVSETLGAVGAGFSYVKNTCGAVSVAVIFLLLLPPLISLLFEKLMFSLCAALAGILGLSSQNRMFTEFSALCDCLTALTVSASVAFIFIIITVIRCGVHIGGG